MTSERARQLREAAEDAENRTIRSIEEHGDLRYLQGTPLDLSDDSPDWLLTKLLKGEGYSHPLIERGKEVENLRREIEAPIEQLRQSRRRLTARGHTATREQIDGFNTHRQIVLEEYRQGLPALNRAITFHNLGVPDALHRKLYLIDAAVTRIASEIPPIDAQPEEGSTDATVLSRLRRLLQRDSPTAE